MSFSHSTQGVLKMNCHLLCTGLTQLRQRTPEEIVGIKVRHLLVWRNGILFSGGTLCNALLKVFCSVVCLYCFSAMCACTACVLVCTALQQCVRPLRDFEGRSIPGPIPDPGH